MGRRVKDADVAAALAGDLLGVLRPELVEFLSRLAAKGGVQPLDGVDAELRLDIELLLPSLVAVDRAEGVIGFRHPDAAGVVEAALRRLRRAAGRETRGLPSINGLIRSGALDEALVQFRREGGAFLSMVHGLNAATSLLRQFPEEIRNSDETLILAAAVNALKSGNVGRAEFIVQERFGVSGARLSASRVPLDAHGTDFQCFRFIYAIYMEETIGQREMAHLFALLGRLPLDGHIQRGLLYNVAADVFVRQHNWETAVEAALRSRHHYERANATLLAFYADLYLALIDLARGRVSEGARQLKHAAARLSSSGDGSPNDRRLLSAFELIAAYEGGDPQPLIAFAFLDDPEARFGEIWPAVAEPIIAYGSLALATHSTLAAARSFLDRWRLQGWRSDRFLRIVNAQEIAVLQMHRRWQEADELLARAAADRASLPAPDIAAARRMLHGQTEDIDLALAASRSALDADPGDAAAAAALSDIAAAPQATARQQAQALLWMAVAMLETGEDEGRRDALVKFFELQEGRGLPALIEENRAVIERAIGNRSARARLGHSSRLARFLRVMSAGAKPSGRAGSGLTGQEERVLFLLAEDAPNKTISRRLGVSVPTVRFHLKNLYRKLGTADRGSAIVEAVKRGLISR